MKRIMAAVLLLVSPTDAWSLTQGSKPTVMPLLSDTGAFVVEALNAGPNNLIVTTSGRCKMRIDAKEIANNPPGGSGSQITVQPNESWRELIRLVRERTSGRRVPNPLPSKIVGNEAVEVHLATGQHTIAFSCGGQWSDDLTFYWIEAP